MNIEAQQLARDVMREIVAVLIYKQLPQLHRISISVFLYISNSCQKVQLIILLI